MKRVDRLLFKIQELERLDDMQLCVAIVGFNADTQKWQAIADLWDGVPGGRMQRLTMEYDSQEEAVKAVNEIEEIHRPSGRKAKTDGAVVIVDDMEYCK